MQIPHVVIPPEAGAFCAMGMIAADVRHDYLRTLPQRSVDWSPETISDLYDELEAEALDALAREGVAREDVVLDRYVDAKYQNQLHEITIPVPGGPAAGRRATSTRSRAPSTTCTASSTRSRWRTPRSTSTTGGSPPSASSTQHEQTPRGAGPEDPTPARKGTREACFSRDASLTTAGVYDGDALRPGMKVTGPAIIERTTTTVVIRPGDVLRVNEVGAFSIKRP